MAFADVRTAVLRLLVRNRTLCHCFSPYTFESPLIFNIVDRTIRHKQDDVQDRQNHALISPVLPNLSMETVLEKSLPARSTQKVKWYSAPEQ
jgi:hypothetical protein